MSVRLSEDAAWAVLEAAHTGIFTTLKRDGMPITLPVWFAVLDRRIYVSGPSKTKKFGRIKNDGRCSFLVESGKRWAELKAVQVNGTARMIDDEPELKARALAAIGEKYAAFRNNRDAMPDAVRAHYAASTSVVEMTIAPRILSWDNARITAPAG